MFYCTTMYLNKEEQDRLERIVCLVGTFQDGGKNDIPPPRLRQAGFEHLPDVVSAVSRGLGGKPIDLPMVRQLKLDLNSIYAAILEHSYERRNEHGADQAELNEWRRKLQMILDFQIDVLSPAESDLTISDTMLSHLRTRTPVELDHEREIVPFQSGEHP